MYIVCNRTYYIIGKLKERKFRLLTQLHAMDTLNEMCPGYTSDDHIAVRRRIYEKLSKVEKTLGWAETMTRGQTLR